MPTVFIPTTLRRLTANQPRIEVAGATVAETLDALEAAHPGFRERLFDASGQVKRFINIFVDDNEIRTLQGLATPVRPADKLSIVPAMAGGSGARLSRDQLLARIRAEVNEATPRQVDEWLRQRQDVAVIDIREHDEWVQGHLPGAFHLSRSFLELQIESLEPDREAMIVLYCAGGVRSLLAAHNLQELGYSRVYSMTGGFNGWKNAGLEFDVPRFLRPDQRERYARHLILPDLGEAGQIKLLDARVLLIGAGGLGSPAALYLAAAGVGTIGIIDYDDVDRSNLQRQILHGESTIGQPKVDSAIQRIKDLNPDVQVIGYRQPLRADNAFEIMRGYDVVLNGSDNFPTRYLVNDACHFLGIPLVDASIFMFEGQVTVYRPDDAARGIEGGPCYRCLYPDPPPPGEVPSCAEAGVLGVLPGIVGSIQAVEAIKLIAGIGQPLVGRLLMYDALDQSFRSLNVQRDPTCPLCGEHPTVTDLIDYEQFCGLPSLPTPSAALGAIPIAVSIPLPAPA